VQQRNDLVAVIVLAEPAKGLIFVPFIQHPNPNDMKYSGLSASLIFALFFLFTDCSKSDPAPSIIGSWRAVNNAASGCTDPLQNLAATTCNASCETLVISSTQITITIPGSSATTVYPYTVSGSTMTITTPSTTIVANFVVSSTTFTISTQATPANGNCLKTTNYSRI
jgi:hypothetical protein